MRIVLPFDDTIPEKYTKYGDDVAPEVEFSEVPEEADYVALVVDDPDAPGAGAWDHWIVWNIPAGEKIPENALETFFQNTGAAQGVNDFGYSGYGGPKPPSGTHTYRFRAYALSEEVQLSGDTNKDQLLDAIKGKVIAKAETEADYTK
ncbi:MAG: YbhB/YbcL family Raf kinase inhibitor-like protein [Candidatus Nanosalina sp.]